MSTMVAPTSATEGFHQRGRITVSGNGCRPHGAEQIAHPVEDDIEEPLLLGMLMATAHPHRK
ncbi:MAG: hypothetical protein IPP31_09825 [Chitinophagaceae bacterium]|nr:hypothetical protein [Chitinophagaceae bacterium]